MAITSLASSQATPSQMAFSTAVAASTTPPSSLGLMSPRLTPKESHLSDSSDGSNSQVTSGGGSGGGPHTHTPGAGHAPMGLTMPLLPHPSASSDDEMEQKYHKNSLFSSFLPIRHLRLRAQEHLPPHRPITSIRELYGTGHDFLVCARGQGMEHPPQPHARERKASDRIRFDAGARSQKCRQTHTHRTRFSTGGAKPAQVYGGGICSSPLKPKSVCPHIAPENNLTDIANTLLLE